VASSVAGQEVISMCDSQEEPVSIGGALAMLDRALDVLNGADAALLPTAVQGQVLRALERAEAKHTAARARMVSAFTAQSGYEDDGQGSARVWLRWQTRVTRGAAAGAVGWARRLAAHPVIAGALASGEISASWAKIICGWSDRLPEGLRQDADRILARAAVGGADLADLAGLAEEMYQRTHTDQDGPADDGFDDRSLALDVTFSGAGRLTGDLTPGCTAALSAVLEALGKKAGPEDTRTAAQRNHDALAEACKRLAAAGTLPGRAGQPTQILVHLGLDQLRDLPGASAAEAAWAAARSGQPGWLTGPEAQAAACDATMVPVVTGHIDPAALDHLIEVFLADHGLQPGLSGPGTPKPGQALSTQSRTRLRNALLALAADALSGPGGLAAHLRAGLDAGPLTSASLPLDVGPTTDIIPVHLRRAVTIRHPHCCFPGCEQPASVCEVHHLIPRSEGGPTALHNLVPLCTFHHLVVIHRWGWTLTLHPNGTTTATSPDSRILHSHSPPATAA
jgi:uncharacterized protein DUF222/HNH endonuclease